MRILIIILLNCLAITTTFAVQESPTSRYFEKIKNNPNALQIFLASMPKGGDLHNHLGGASMAEKMIQYAQGDHLCVDRNSKSVVINPQCAASDSLDNIYQDTALYNALINAWSMRNFYPGIETGHDHFFGAFSKYHAINHAADMMAEVAARADSQNEIYLELMMTLDGNASGKLGKSLGFDPDFSVMRKKLLDNGLVPIIDAMPKSLDSLEAQKNKILLCEKNPANPGCGIKVRYLYQVLREQPPEQVFAQLLAGFEIANKDPRVVGINMVQAEDGMISMRDYHLHMQMVGFLHDLYPNVHIALHAGELTKGLVSPEGLSFHIRDAVETAHADRIGHGVDIAYENNADALLKKMSAQHTLVEINLTSNAAILDVQGKDHPLPLYLKYRVPAALSTDDEGVLRTDLTQQYVQAVLNFGFSYPEIKKLVRNTISYSFLPGKNLWDGNICVKEKLGDPHPSAECQQFLDANEKAATQWQLENRFAAFEEHYANTP